MPELPANAALSLGVIWEKLPVHDVSIGGMAFVTTEALRDRKLGDRMTLRLSLGVYGEHEIVADLRYVAEGTTGIQFVDLTPAATTAIRKYVAELLERGAMS